MIKINNLHASVEGNDILKGLTLEVKPGEVHAIMGPNGSGKSTLASVLAGRDVFEVTDGGVMFQGEDLLEMDPEERAWAGLFLAFQYPVEIPGVSNINFLRTALNEIKKQRGEDELSAKEFLALVKEKSKLVELDGRLKNRSVNEGFSGGEKKRNEIFQMAMLDPKLAVLDETDSGLDIDALRIVANGVNTMRDKNRSFIVITHYQRLLDHIVPDFVHILYDGRIVKSGDRNLALELEEKGLRLDKRRTTNSMRSESVIEVQKVQSSDKKSDFLNRIAGIQQLKSTPQKKLGDQWIQENDFPTRRTEAWKYSRVSKILSQSLSFNPVQKSSELSEYFIPGIEGPKLVFVNGFFSDDHSSINPIEGLSIEEKGTDILPGFDQAENIFSGLNLAYTTSVMKIKVNVNQVINDPIQILYLNDDSSTFAQPRLAFEIGEGAELEIIQINAGNADGGFHNGITSVDLGANASVKWDKIQCNRDTQFQLEQDFILQEKDSRFSVNTFSISGGWIRNELNIKVNGTNCFTDMYGSYILKGNQHLDNHTTVDHIAPHCESNELYKGVVYEKATAVFNGKVFVRPDAQKTNAFQSNGNILMSDDATVNSKPELEIYADDVKCSHGSTTGQIDEEAIFYLRTRGLSEENARQTMVTAFIGEVVEHAHREKTKEWVIEKLRAMDAWTD